MRRLDPIASGVLRAIERIVRTTYEPVERHIARIEGRDSEARRDPDQVPEGALERGGLEGRAAVLGDRSDPFEIGLGREDREFLAPVSTDDVDSSLRRRREHLPDVTERLVADVMPIPIVDRLEVIDVDQHETGRRPESGGTRDLVLGELEEVSS